MRRYDNHYAEQPKGPEDGYHLTEDLTDKAIGFIRDAKVVAPDKPFFMYFCPGATHAPHHAPKEWIEKYKGKFDMGYEAYREQVFQCQQLGILPESAELSPINPYADTTSHDGTQTWPEGDTVRPWDSLSDGEKALFCRMAEVYAGFLSHADHHIGRLLDYRGGPERRQGHRRAGHRRLPGERPWAFAGGTIKQVIVDVSGEHYIDLEKEAVAMMSRE